MLFPSWKVKSKGLGEEKLLWKTISFRISIFIFDFKKKDGFTFNFVSYHFFNYFFLLPYLVFFFFSFSIVLISASMGTL